MEKRRRQRIQKRVTCQLEDGIRRATGIVRDISEHGFFVQTSFGATTDSLVHLVFPPVEENPEIRIEAGVARKRTIPRQLQGSVPSGLGLEIIPPGRELHSLIKRFGVHSIAALSTAPAPQSTSGPEERAIIGFRVRLIERGGAQSRLLMVRCATEAGARARALARVGSGWKIANVQRV